MEGLDKLFKKRKRLSRTHDHHKLVGDRFKVHFDCKSITNIMEDDQYYHATVHRKGMKAQQYALEKDHAIFQNSSRSI
jgi:hypothetical protein